MYKGLKLDEVVIGQWKSSEMEKYTFDANSLFVQCFKANTKGLIYGEKLFQMRAYHVLALIFH